MITVWNLGLKTIMLQFTPQFLIILSGYICRPVFFSLDCLEIICHPQKQNPGDNEYHGLVHRINITMFPKHTYTPLGIMKDVALLKGVVGSPCRCLGTNNSNRGSILLIRLVYKRICKIAILSWVPLSFIVKNISS